MDVVQSLEGRVRELAEGTSSQKRRAWRELIHERRLWLACEQAQLTTPHGELLETCYRLLATEWSHQPLVDAHMGTPDSLDRTIGAALRILAAARLAQCISQNREWDLHAERWAYRALGLKQEPILPPPAVDLPRVARIHSSADVREQMERLAQTAPQRLAELAALEDALAQWLDPTLRWSRVPEREVQVPLLLAESDGKSHVAMLCIERLADGRGTVYPRVESQLDLPDERTLGAVLRAEEVARRHTRWCSDFEVRWYFERLPRARGGGVLPVGGRSLETAMAAGLVAIAEGRRLRPRRLASACLDEDGSLLPVGGIARGAKLEAACAYFQPESGVVIVSPENALTPADVQAWQRRGVGLVTIPTFRQALDELVLPAHAAAAEGEAGLSQVPCEEIRPVGAFAWPVRRALPWAPAAPNLRRVALVVGLGSLAGVLAYVNLGGQWEARRRREMLSRYAVAFREAQASLDAGDLDRTRVLLNEAARQLPGPMPWEWRRLAYLCGESGGRVSGGGHPVETPFGFAPSAAAAFLLDRENVLREVSLVAGTPPRELARLPALPLDLPIYRTEPALSGDGRLLAWADANYSLPAPWTNVSFEISIRSLQQGTQTHLTGRGWQPLAVRLGGDGRFVAAMLADGPPPRARRRVAAWNLDTRRLCFDQVFAPGQRVVFDLSRQNVLGVAADRLYHHSLEGRGAPRVSPAVGSRPSVVTVWERGVAAAYSPEDGSGGRTQLVVWSDGDLTRRELATAQIKSLQIDPRGSLLALGAWDGTVQIVDRSTLRPRWSAARQQTEVSSLHFSSRGDLLLSGSRDGTVRLWRLEDPAQPTDATATGAAAGALPAELEPATESPWFVVDEDPERTLFSDRERWALTDRRSGRTVWSQRLAGSSRGVLLPEGRLAVAGTGWVRLGTPEQLAPPLNVPGSPVALYPLDSRRLVVVSTDGTFVVDRGVTRLTSGISSRSQADFAENGKLLALLNRGRLELWDLAGLRRLWIKPVAGRPAIGLNAGGTRLVVARPERIELWDTKEQRLVASYPGRSATSHVDLSPDGQTLAVATRGPSVWLLQAETGAMLWSELGTSARRVPGFDFVVFSSDGNSLIGTGEFRCRWRAVPSSGRAM